MTQSCQIRGTGSESGRTIFSRLRFGACASVAALGLLSACGSARVANPKDWASVSITLARTICSIHCPVYKVTISGTGGVEYDGLQGVPVRGHRASGLPREKIEAILEAMDRYRFISIDDKIFGDATDTGYLVISLSADGKNKQIRGIDFGGDRRLPMKLFLFSRTAREQTRFLKLADEIESVVGTERWTKCSPKCMVLVGAPFWTDSRGPDGSTILLQAIKSKKDVTLGSVGGSNSQNFDPNTMIEAGVDVNAPNNQGLTPLMAAAKNGDLELVRNLLAHGANPNARDQHQKLASNYTVRTDIRGLLSPAGGGVSLRLGTVN